MSKLVVSSSPHIKSANSTNKIMLMVITALLPSAIMAFVLFGVSAILVIGVSVVSCVLIEFLYTKLMKMPTTIGDLSAVVTGILIGFSLPPTFPIWMNVVGCFFAIIITKQLFGGLGRNFANPAIIGRIILTFSFGSALVNTAIPNGAADTAAGATPLSGGFVPSYLDLAIGRIPGMIGEVSKIALIIGGLYLIFMRVITITTPLAYLASCGVVAFLFGGDPIMHLLTGSVILGAFFMATDYVTSPTTESGKLIFGIGCGVLTMLIRLFGSYPEGVSFSIILMNTLVPHIDNLTMTRPIGGARDNG